MRFTAIEALADPLGNRVRLTWRFPAAPLFPGVRIVRRAGSHPTRPDDGVIVAEGIGLESTTDAGLKGETVYYYSLFGYRGTPQEFDSDRANRAEVLVTSPHGHADQMQALLPAIYHRYDRSVPNDPSLPLAPADRQRGPLQRFLDLPGSQLDLLYSHATATLDLYNVQRVQGSLLPQLAAWIGWNIDQQVEVETQRNEIRHAPFVYRTVGLKPAIEAAVKRISGWESRTKEFIHNVLRTNQPERLNLWIKQSNGNDWSAPPQLLSLDHAYDGRPALVRTADGTAWLLFHTIVSGRWQIRYKRRPAGGAWSPSQPLVPASRASAKHPTVAVVGGAPRAFWSELDAGGTWRLVTSQWSGTAWSTPAALAFANNACLPTTCVDGGGNLWLFWIERAGNKSTLRYNRHDGSNWGAPLALPLDAGIDPRVESDVVAMFDSTANRIWIAWSRQVVLSGVQTRREIAYRIKANVTFDANGWSTVRTFPRPPNADYHDREPMLRQNTTGRCELYWSSSRGSGGYDVWRSELTNEAGNTWSAAEQLSGGPYTQSAPYVLGVGGNDKWLIYRSNQSLAYPSTVYAATLSSDFRYSGATTVHVRATDRIALRGSFDDFGTYVYDAGSLGKRGPNDRYAHDTIGLYVDSGTATGAVLDAGLRRIAGVLGDFMPATSRAVFITSASTP